MTTLRVEKLVKAYGKRTVVDRVSFHVETGEVVGLLGPNGAGKTQTFRMTVGLIHPNEGAVLFDEEDITDLPMYRRARKGIAYLPQEPSIFRKLTVGENILAVLERQRLSKAERMERKNRLLREFGLTKLEHSKAYTLSGGEQRRVEIARTLAIDPSFILLDEPFSGIDPKTIHDIQEVVTQLKERGLGIIMTDHNAAETLEIADRGYLIVDGKILMHGTPEELIRSELARRLYFGDTDYRGPKRSIGRAGDIQGVETLREPRASSQVTESCEQD